MSSSPQTPAPRILFTSLSRKTSLYDFVLEQARAFHPKAEVTGGDSNPDCPGRTRVEEFIETPPLEQSSADEFAAFCAENGFTHLIPTRDGELSFFAEARDVLLAAGVHVMVSPPDTVRVCLDKFLFASKASELGIPAIPTAETPSSLEAERFVVKERHGSGSRGIHLDLSAEEAAQRASGMEEPVFQPYLEGRELSADLYVDRSGQTRGAVLRWRDLVVDGESKVTTTFRKAEWERDLGDLAAGIGLRGHGLVQAIVDEEYQLHVLEINARLGGATPLALSCGLQSIEWFLQESAGQDLETVEPFTFPSGQRLVRDEEGRDEFSGVE